MKPHRYKAFLFVLVLMASINLQSQTLQGELTGTWVFDYDTSFSKIEAPVKARLDSMPQAQRLRIENTYKERTITFKPNGDYVQILSDGRKTTGAWILNHGTNSISITSSRGNTQELKIKTLTSTALILKPSEVGEIKGMVPEWHYIKN